MNQTNAPSNSGEKSKSVFNRDKLLSELNVEFHAYHGGWIVYSDIHSGGYQMDDLDGCIEFVLMLHAMQEPIEKESN